MRRCPPNGVSHGNSTEAALAQTSNPKGLAAFTPASTPRIAISTSEAPFSCNKEGGGCYDSYLADFPLFIPQSTKSTTFATLPLSLSCYICRLLHPSPGYLCPPTDHHSTTPQQSPPTSRRRLQTSATKGSHLSDKFTRPDDCVAAFSVSVLWGLGGGNVAS